MIYFISRPLYDSLSDLFYLLPKHGQRIGCCRDPTLCETKASSAAIYPSHRRGAAAAPVASLHLQESLSKAPPRAAFISHASSVRFGGVLAVGYFLAANKYEKQHKYMSNLMAYSLLHDVNSS